MSSQTTPVKETASGRADDLPFHCRKTNALLPRSTQPDIRLAHLTSSQVGPGNKSWPQAQVFWPFLRPSRWKAIKHNWARRSTNEELKTSATAQAAISSLKGSVREGVPNPHSMAQCQVAVCLKLGHESGGQAHVCVCTAAFQKVACVKPSLLPLYHLCQSAQKERLGSAPLGGSRGNL